MGRKAGICGSVEDAAVGEVKRHARQRGISLITRLQDSLSSPLTMALVRRAQRDLPLPLITDAIAYFDSLIYAYGHRQILEL